MKLKSVSSLDELIQCYCVRAIVFSEGQNIPYSIERDGLDMQASHVLGCVDDEPIATARFRILSDYAKIERVAVRPSFRQKGLGKALMNFTVEQIRELKLPAAKVHAQAYLEAFYLDLGFEICGEVFYEADIAHLPMIKRF